jgi:glycosyltransferase involved in cell wall biosynthesis
VRPAPGLRICFVYDIDLPSRLAAPIQILNTAHALAGLGVRTTVAFGAIAADDDAQALAPYGLDPRPELSLLALRGRASGSSQPPGWRPFVDTAVRFVEREAAAAGPLAVIGRGETGVRVLPVLAAMEHASRPLVVYEAHRLGWLNLGQQRASSTRGRIAKAWRVPAEWARVDGVVAISAGLASAMRRTLPFSAPVLVLPSGTRRVATVGDAPRDLDVVYAGKLVARKGVEFLVQAMRDLPGRQLVVLGGSRDEVARARQFADHAGVGERVHFEGFVEPARVGEWLRRARAGACPLPVGVEHSAERFTSSLKALELMAHGVPVVATDVPAIRELLGPHRDAAVIVPPNDPGALADGINRVLADRALADRLARAGRARAEELSWERRAERLATFVSGLVDGQF